MKSSKILLRVSSVLLAVLIALSAGACAKGGGQSDSSGSSEVIESSGSVDSSVPEQAVEPRVITCIGMDYTNASRPWRNVESCWDWPAGKAFTEKLKELNIDLQYEFISTEQYSDTMKARMASFMDIPDITRAPGGTTDYMEYAKSGNFWNVTELLETHDGGANIMDFLKTNCPTTLSTITDKNGNLWWFPYCYRVLNSTGSAFMLELRTDWMDALGIEFKNFYTLDELYDILAAFREKDANGNGVADEVLSFDPSGEWEPISAGFGMGPKYIYALNDGKGVRAKIDHENFPDFIRYCQRLYQAGIFSTEILNKDNQIESGNRASAIFNYNAQAWVDRAVVGYEDTAEYAGIVIDDDGGVNGYTLSARDNTDSCSMAWMISKSAKEPQAIVDLMEYIYSTQGYIDSYFGVEGVGLEWDEEYNLPQLIRSFNLMTEENVHEYGLFGVVFQNLIPAAYINDYGSLERDIKTSYVEGYDYKNTSMDVLADALTRVGKDVCWYNQTQPLALPTDEETKVIKDKSNELSTYMHELFLDLILGNKSLDDLPAYREELKNLGLDEMLEVYQARYDRYMAAQK